MEKKDACFVCTRDVVREAVYKGQTLGEWLDGPTDGEGKPKLDEEGKVITGFKAKRLYTGPTLTSKSTKKHLIGTGIYAAETKGNLTKTFE